VARSDAGIVRVKILNMDRLERALERCEALLAAGDSVSWIPELQQAWRGLRPVEVEAPPCPWCRGSGEAPQ